MAKIAKPPTENRFETVLVSAQQLATQGLTSVQRQIKFDRQYSAWLAEQNVRFEAEGLWCDELRVW